MPLVQTMHHVSTTYDTSGSACCGADYSTYHLDKVLEERLNRTIAFGKKKKHNISSTQRNKIRNMVADFYLYYGLGDTVNITVEGGGNGGTFSRGAYNAGLRRAGTVAECIRSILVEKGDVRPVVTHLHKHEFKTQFTIRYITRGKNKSKAPNPSKMNIDGQSAKRNVYVWWNISIESRHKTHTTT